MRILITGGSGYLGRALTKHWRDEHTVCVYSRDEHKQALLEAHPNLRRMIGDVRDRDRLRRAADRCDVMILAAALKRIETGRINPREMVLTNVIGTMNAIEVAQDVSTIGQVLLVSTDKAWQPISAYGQTKALAESLVLAANDQVAYRHPKFSVVRYGNVMGSTGSVVPIWRAAVARGERVRLTDPNVTRFWMDVNDAVMLIDGSMSAMQGGERFVPRLPAFRLADLAEAMGVKYDVTGLPAWEKLHEGLDDDQTSDQARRMSVDEIRERLAEIA